MDGEGLGPFLKARRAEAKPDRSTLCSGWRRVPGLRREEVAVLAGISVDYHARLKQGRERHPSAQVLDARAHMYRLAGLNPVDVAESREQVGPELLRLMDAWPARAGWPSGWHSDGTR